MSSQIQQRRRQEHVDTTLPLSQIMVCALQTHSPSTVVLPTTQVSWEEKLYCVFCEFHPAQELSTTGKKWRVQHFDSDPLFPI